MSIRHKIFLPALAGLLMGFLFSGYVAWQGWSGYLEVSRIVESANTSNNAVRDIIGQFKNANNVVDRVTAMTDFVNKDDIQKGFDSSTLALKVAMSSLKSSALSADMSQLVRELEAEFKDWVKDASLVLGLTQANQIPTIEKLNRHRSKVAGFISVATRIQERDASQMMAQSGAAMKSSLLQAGVIALVAMLMGAVGAFILARNISLPLTNLVSAAEKLSAGNTETQFKCLQRSDEIGAVGRAIAGFRDNVLESARLEEASRSDLLAREERQLRIQELIEEFDREADSHLASVEEKMGIMQQTAVGVTGLAEETTHKAMSASDASAAASSNVQTVASAA